MKTLSKILACGVMAAGLVVSSHAAVQTAGTLLVNIDPSSGPMPLGSFSNIVNLGTAGGIFEATGIITNNTNGGGTGQPVIVQTPGGAYAMMFDGTSFLQHRTATTTSGGTNQYPPTQLTGTNPVCSIEVWALNPTISAEENMVFLGARTATTNELAFNYGAGGGSNNGTNSVVVGNGAVGHGSQFNAQSVNTSLNWGAAPPAPGIWHHLVYTFDGTTTKVYCDGVLQNSAVLAPFVLSSTLSITVADERTSTTSTSNPSGTLTGGTHASMMIGKVRIDSGVLTPTQIVSNYNLESPTFTLTPAALAGAPAHDYLFTNAPNGDASMTPVADIGTLANAPAEVIGATNGRVYYTGSALHLEGGPTTTGPFVKMPSFMVSTNAAANGGTGLLTVEGWLTVRGDEGGNWQTYFSFGESTTAITNGVGAGGNGENYFEFTQDTGDRDFFRMEVTETGGYNGALGSITHDAAAENQNTPYNFTHYAVSWNEATGEMIVYLNGIESSRVFTPDKMNQIDDTNCMLGRDQWQDPTLQGDYKEFRIYYRVLSPAEILGDYEAGPGKVVTSLGTPTALHVTTVNTNTWSGSSSQVVVTADYATVSGVNVTANSGVSFTSSNPSVATVQPGEVQYVGNGSANLVAALGSLSATDAVTVITPIAQLVHEYNFNGPDFSFAITDSVAGAPWAGTANGSAFIQSNALQLDGILADTSYASFPAGLVTGNEAVTVELWANFAATTINNFVYGFGDTDTNTGAGRYYLFSSSHSNTRMAITDDDPGYVHEETTAENGIVLDGDNNAHVVTVYFPAAGYERIYLNGVLLAQETNCIQLIKQAVVDNLNYVGKSLYTADPYFAGSIDELRIYNGVLTQSQVALTDAAGPNNLGVLTTGPGTLSSVSLASTNTLQVLVTVQAQFLGTFQNVTNLNLLSYGGATINSDNTAVLTVTPAGVIKAINPGMAHIIASYGGLSATNTITVQNVPAALAHRYSFTSDYSDSIGGAPWVGTPEVDAQLVTLNGENQVQLDGTTGTCVSLPSGILSNYTSVTFETWATFGSNTTGVPYLYAFGDFTNNDGRFYVDMSPSDGGAVRINITPNDPGAGNEQFASYAGNLYDQTNVHVAVVVSPFAGYEALYINGSLTAINTNLTAFLSSVRDNYSYLGQSLYTADPNLICDIDEFRIWNGALTPQQIALDAAAGPNQVSPGQTNAGTFTNVTFNVGANLVLGQSETATLLGTSSTYTNVEILTYGSPAPVLVSGNPNVVSINGATVTAAGPGTTSVSVTYNSVTYSNNVTVTIPPVVLAHRYSFSDAPGSTNCIDSIAGPTWNGTLPNGGTYNGTGQLSCIGAGNGTNYSTNQYILLPPGILSNYTAVTIDSWVTFGTLTGTPQWLAFGNTDGTGLGEDYIFQDPLTSRMAITAVDPGDSAEQTTGTGPSLSGVATHLTLIWNPPAGVEQEYENGNLVESAAISDPLSSVSPTLNYIGRSLYTADGGYNFTIDELRIFSGAMTAGEVTASQSAGANALPLPRLTITITNGDPFAITWPTWTAQGSAALYSSPSLSSPVWTPVTNVPVNIGTSFQVIVSPNGGTEFYSLRQ